MSASKKTGIRRECRQCRMGYNIGNDDKGFCTAQCSLAYDRAVRAKLRAFPDRNCQPLTRQEFSDRLAGASNTADELQMMLDDLLLQSIPDEPETEEQALEFFTLAVWSASWKLTTAQALGIVAKASWKEVKE
jgi:hypothetical protein